MEVGEDVAEIVVWVDVVEATRKRDAVGNCGTMAAGF
jgi:hypothetical protein